MESRRNVEAQRVEPVWLITPHARTLQDLPDMSNMRGIHSRRRMELLPAALNVPCGGGAP